MARDICDSLTMTRATDPVFHSFSGRALQQHDQEMARPFRSIRRDWAMLARLEHLELLARHEVVENVTVASASAGGGIEPCDPTEMIGRFYPETFRSASEFPGERVWIQTGTPGLSLEMVCGGLGSYRTQNTSEWQPLGQVFQGRTIVPSSRQSLPRLTLDVL